MAYQLYRNTTLGNALQEILDELVQVWWKYDGNMQIFHGYSFSN